MKTISDASSRSCIDRRPGQSGQAVIEFFLAMIIIIAGATILYQGLHFEREVFNRLGMQRLQAMRDVHRDQENTRRTYFTVTGEFRTLGEVTPYDLPFGFDSDDPISPLLSYGPKEFFVRGGTRYNDPFEELFPMPHGVWGLAAEITAVAHYEGTKSLFQDVNFRPRSVPTYCQGYWYVTPPSLLACRFLDPYSP